MDIPPIPRRSFIGLGAASLYLAATGRSSDAGASREATRTALGRAPTAPTAGGSVTYAIASVGARFDPALQTIYSFSPAPVLNAIFGNLLYAIPGSPEIHPGFLESFTASDDGTTWTAVLRTGLRFSDETDFDAEAIAFNIRRAADPETGSPFRPVAEILTLDVQDATTLVIELPEPNLHFDAVFLESFACVGSPAAITDMGDAFSTAPVGAGPFKFKTAVEGQSLTLERNPMFETVAEGQPYLDEITFQMLPDYPRQAAALASNAAQLALASGQQGVQVMKDTSGADVQEWQTGGGGLFLFNNAVEPFNNPVARRAVTLALDRNAIGPAFAAGTPPSTNLFPDTSPFYDPANDWIGHDPEEAQRLFNQLADEGTPLSFTLKVFATFPDSVNAGNLIQSTLAEFDNVEIEIEGRQTADALADIRERNFEMMPDGIYMEFPVPDVTEYFRSSGTLNYASWDNAAVDDAIAAIYVTKDEAEMKAQWDVVLQQFNEDLPMYFANQGILAFASSKDLTGLTVIGHGFAPQWGELGYRG